MNSSDTEEITDEIIGEAVLALLKTNRPITAQPCWFGFG